MAEKEQKGKNLFEVNGIKYTDNIPNGMRISLTTEQYSEYLQQKELIERLQKEITKLQEIVRLQNEDSIPKYKIREKRKQEEEILRTANGVYGVIKYREGKIQAYDELLEEG